MDPPGKVILLCGTDRNTSLCKMVEAVSIDEIGKRVETLVMAGIGVTVLSVPTDVEWETYEIAPDRLTSSLCPLIASGLELYFPHRPT